MSWRGRSSFTFALVSVALALLVATFAGAAPPSPQPQLGPLSPFKLADGAPKALGPSIVDAVYRATVQAGAGNDSLYVIFNEDLNSVSVGAADFNFNGGLASGDVGGLAGGSIVYVRRNLVVMSGFTTAYANGDSVQVSVRGAIVGADGSVSSDVTLVQIRTGPAVYRAEYLPSGYDNTPNGDVVRLYLTHEITGGLDTANPRLDFDMAEFGTGTGNLTSALVGGLGNKAVDITFGNQEAASVASHGKVLAAVSKIRLLSGSGIQGRTNNIANDNTTEGVTAAPYHVIDQMVGAFAGAYLGPQLVAAGYNTKNTGGLNDDVLTLVFSDDVDPSTVTIGDFTFSTSPSTPVLLSNDGDHILQIQDFTGGAALVGGTVQVTGSVSDFQGNPNAPQAAFTIAASPIIVHARYQDGGDSDPATDIVELYFDTPMIGSFADTTDFNYFGFVSNGLIVTDNTDNDSLLTLTGFTNSNNWEPGDRIAVRSGSNLVAGGPPSLPSGNGLGVTDFSTRIIRDYSAPRQLLFTLNSTYFRDAQTTGTSDTAFYAFNELNVDDSNYYILFTRKGVPVDRIYIETHLNNGQFIANPNPGYQALADLNKNVIGTYNITPFPNAGFGTYSDGQNIALGDNVYFGICAVDADGNLALNTSSCLFVGALVAGPVPPPRDHDCAFNEITGYYPAPGLTTDTDMIHITGNRNPDEHFIFGDAGSAIGADSIRVYDDAGLTTLLGTGPANPVTGTFAKFSIGQPTSHFVYVTAVDVVAGSSTESSPTPIRNDLYIYDALYSSTFRDPINSLRLYSPGDTVRIVGAATDTAGSPAAPVVASGRHKSDLLALSADFRKFSTKAGSDSVLFISLGANKNDEDNDWIDDGAVSFNNTALAGNTIRDYPEPYVDENGNGIYDCGETFADYSGAAYTAKIWDAGDSNLDSNDPQEHGWYYVEYWIDPADATLVPDPDGGDNFAVFKDVPIPIRILDNALTAQADMDNLSADVDRTPARATMQFDSDQSLKHLTNTGLSSPFVASIDALAPSVSKIYYLAHMNSLTQALTYPSGNLITPGEHVYELPAGLATPYVNFVDSTLSDDDVTFLAVQIDTTANSSTSQTEGGWRYLSLDPPGDRGGAPTGTPGIPLFDDDYDSLSAKSNAIDDDEDGAVDEDGEGVDLSDAQVVDALQADLAADAAAPNPDGICRINDGIDNDNDAFFRFNPFIGAIVWFNVDESTTNTVDDDGDGTVDEADEVENYVAANDDDEDGMADGSVTQISNALTYASLVGVGAPQTIYVKAFEDPAVLAKYRGSKSTKPTTSVSATPGSWLASYIDKTSDVIGNPSGFADPKFTANKGGKDNFSGTAFARGARNIISAGGVAQSNGLPVPWFGATILPGNNSFDWDYRAQTLRNLDMRQIKALYNLVDGSEYRIRAVAVDDAMNFEPSWATSVRFKLDSVAPVVCIPPAHKSATPGTGALPEFDDFVDVRPSVPGLQVYDKGAHPGPYTLQADVVSGNDIKDVYFQMWNGLGWVNMPAAPANPDGSFPYTLYWDAPLLSNAPPADADTFYFRAYAVDEWGNTEAQFLLNDAPTPGNGPAVATCVDDARVWELQVIVIDGTPPSACLCQVGSDYDLTDGAQVPVEQAVDVSGWFTDNDLDPATNDVIHVYFEYTPIGANTWTPFGSLTGVPADGYLRDPSGINHPILVTGPDTLKVTVTWDTRTLPAGSYEIRCVAVDIEGNTSVLTSCVFTVTIDNTALRAYIQPVVAGVNTLDTCGIAATDTLYAQVFIHDRTVSQVEFQYYKDTNDNGLADDGGSSWVSIFIQGDDVSERKGDVTLRAGTAPFKIVDGAKHFKLPGATWSGGTDYIRFWDPDNNGYSSIDPIVVDANNNMVYDGGDFVVVFGPGNASPSNGTALKNFSDDEYIAQSLINVNYAHDYIMQDNPLNPYLCDFCVSETDVWKALWDITGLNGSYLVRAIATDNLGNTDSDLPGTPIPTARIIIDSVIPKATVTSITLQDKSTFNIPPQSQYISAENSFFFVNATTTDTDIQKVLFEYSRDGGVTWNTLDVNDDNDYYSDLNQNWQFDEGIDEIFVDVDGNCLYSAGDIVLSKGDNGTIDTPTDASSKYAQLFPLVGEDWNDGSDNDGDGKTDEDDNGPASALGGQSPEDWFTPYSVPFLFHNLVFPTETNVIFRATATDFSGNTDCDPDLASVVVGDNVAPETDVVVAVVNGDSLNIETVLRGTLSPYCFNSENIGPMSLLVTAEDQSEIQEVDIYYRKVPVVPAFPAVEYQSAGLIDTTYPYEFVWDITALADGEYEFYPRAVDANGNHTMAPLNPYHFSIMRTTASVASAVFLGSNIPVTTDVAEGDVVVLTANVSNPGVDGKVKFYIAERIQGETVTGISTSYPFTSGPLTESVVPATGNGINEKVYFDGVDGNWIDPSAWASTTGKTYTDYTFRSGGSIIEFGAAVPTTVVVTIDYNIEYYTQLGRDVSEPYSTEFTVPEPDFENATHWDIIASFKDNVDTWCEEEGFTEGLHIGIRDTEASKFVVHGIDDINNNGDISLDDNMPGNEGLCVSQGLGWVNNGIGHVINKLSGDWAEFFVTADNADDFTSVVMTVTNTAGTFTLPFTKNPYVADPDQVVHKVLYVSDFPTLDPTRVENVTIKVSGYPTAPSTRTFAMYDDGSTSDDLVAGDGHYTVRLELPAGHTYSYTYTIDLVGDDFITNVADPRHNESQIQVPSPSYWFASTRLDNDVLLLQNAVNHVVITVTDAAGNTATNESTGNQGQIDVVLDRVAPSVAELRFDRNVLAPGADVEIFATIVDPIPADVNIIAVPSVLFQVSPDASHKVWLDWFTDTNPGDGWGTGIMDPANWPYNPRTDNIDNDEDGQFDEADEANFVYWVRAVPTDDCFNRGYSNLQNPPVVVPVTVDAQAPVCELATPINGAIFSVGSTITLTTKPSSDTDVLYGSFQYDAGDGWTAIDATPIDDTDVVDGFDGTETPQLHKNPDGTMTVTFSTAFMTQADFYVRLRCVARDVAGNFTGNQGPFSSGDPVVPYITILMNDTTAPLAALTMVFDNGPAYIFKSIVDPALAISDQVLLGGQASGGRTGDVATVQLQYSTDNGTTWLDGGTTNVIFPFSYFGGNPQWFFIAFNTTALNLPDGDVWLRTAAMDHDGNLQGDANGNGILESNETVPGTVKVTIDNSDPTMWLTQVGPVTGAPVPDNTLIVADLWPREVARGGEYEVDDLSLRLADDITFRAADPNDGSTDVIDMIYLQFYDDWTDPSAPRWQPSFPTIPTMDQDQNGILDTSEIAGWLGDLEDYMYALDDFWYNSMNFRFAYRDDAGNNGPPGAPADGKWYLQFPSNSDLKAAMAGLVAPEPGDGDGDGEEGPYGLPTSLPDKVYQFRSLAVDYAGNANTGFLGHALRIDATNPYVEEVFVGNNEIEAGGGDWDPVQVAGGDTVPLAALVIDDFPAGGIQGRTQQLKKQGFDPDLPGTDSESAGIHGVRFEFSADYQLTQQSVTPASTYLGASWTTIGLGTYDSVHGFWTIDWTTPKNLARSATNPQTGQGSSTTDSVYAVRVTVVDSAGNYTAEIRDYAAIVQDITPPDDTEIVDINGRTYPRSTNEETVRDPLGTWVAGTVELQAATQYGDPSMIPNNSDASDDVFRPTVFFEARRKGSNDWILIGDATTAQGEEVIEPAPGVTGLQNHLGPVWTINWNTLQLNGAGQRIWTDGTYDVRAWGRDAWGNTELLTSNEAPMTVLVTVDNTAPVAEVDLNPTTPTRDVEANVERNNSSGFTFMVRTADNNEDIKMYYYYKLSTDLNVPGSWQMISPGMDASDQNPDKNRPFSFDWDTNSIANCDGTLVPGQTYDICFSAEDLLENVLSVVDAHDKGYSSRLHVVDTQAPKATITELVRNVGNANPVEFPTQVRIRSVDYIQATILNGHRDTEAVRFYFAPKTGSTPPAPGSAWTLADGDIKYVGDQTWRLKRWDSSGLAEGSWWFTAIAEDCYSNVDATPAAIELIIDRTGPQFVGVNPSDNEILYPEITSVNGPRNIDLIVRNTDNDVDYTTFNNNAIYFQYKKSETADRDENWVTITYQELRDGGTGTNANQQPTFSAAIDLRTLQGDGLYDWRVVADDVAGNRTFFQFGLRSVVDNTKPVVEITNVAFPNRPDFTVQPVNGNVLPNISAGETVKIYVTASDDEPQIPNTNETGIKEVQFFLASGPEGSGTYPQTIGTAGFDDATGQYYINWNTTGLPDGNYSIYAQGIDDARNIGVSQTVTGNVTNPAKPLAQVVGFNPDLLSEITKGTNNRIYGLTFGEKLANTMFFQYRVVPTSGSPGEWVNIGAATNTGEVLDTRELSLLPMSLWFSNMRISDFADGTQLDMRAVAVASSNLDSLSFSGNIATEPVNGAENGYYGRTVNTGFATQDGDPGTGDFSGLYDLDNTPIIRMIKRSGATGQAFLEFGGNAPDLVTSVEGQGIDFLTYSLFTVKTTNARVSPFVTVVAEDGTGLVKETVLEMNRRIDDNTTWTGNLEPWYTSLYDLDPTEGARVTVFATAHTKRASTTELPPRIDMASKTWYIHQVTPVAGSNGVAGISHDGNPTDDNFAYEVPPGAYDTNVGMLLDTVNRPVTPTEQDLYMTAFGPTYRVYMITEEWDDCDGCANDEGWQAHGWLKYNDEDPAIRMESEVTVRRWDGSSWTASGLSHIEVDTLANVIRFTFDHNASGEGLLVPIFSAVTADRFSPLTVQAYPWWRGYTDQDPIFKAILNNPGTPIDPGTIRVFVDGTEVAARRGSYNWYLYNNSWMNIEQIDSPGYRYEVTFGWPCDNITELQGGMHTFEVWYSDYSRSTYYGVNQPWYFEVDRTPPTIVLNGGFVGDPKQKFVPAYVGGDGTNAITVKLIDSGAGVLFREDRIDDDDYSHYWWDDVEDYCAIARYELLYDEWFYDNNIPIQFDQDNGFKYDLWVVDPVTADDQTSVDEIEERTLLHTGTADELWPNVTFSENGDTLTVPLYILGGGRIKDGDVLELVLYSKRYEIQPLTSLNDVIDWLQGVGGYWYYESSAPGAWWIDFSTKRLIQYASSIQDNVGNAGSRFLEQRFIVDKSAPTVEVLSPGITCDGTPAAVPFEPTTDYSFNANLVDGQNGSGVKPSSVTVTITGPVKEGDADGKVTIQGLSVTADKVSFVIPKSELLVGQYRIRIKGEDLLGNKFDKECVLYVGGMTNSLANAYVFPNPFNPGTTDATFTFENAKSSDVVISVYDWNGDKVRTIHAGNLPAGQNLIKWGGDTEDGQPLANGAYLARIEANDGVRTVTQVLKVAIWRE